MRQFWSNVSYWKDNVNARVGNEASSKRRRCWAVYESVEGVECISGKSCREERKAEREVTLRELEIREKELALSKRDLEEKIKIRPKVYLPNVIEGEDIEVFLKSFEKLANCYKWDKTEWAIRLVPKLSGKALETYSRMPVSTSDDYELVKTGHSWTLWFKCFSI